MSAKFSVWMLMASLVVTCVLVECRVDNSNSKQQSTDDDGISVSDVTNKVLERHNQLRAQHGAPALKQSQEATSNAMRRARVVAQNGKLEHESQSKFGENLAMHSDVNEKPNNLVQMWYDEEKDYDYNNPGFDPKTGHFTQLVWKSTNEVGCALAKTSGGSAPGAYLACNYSPPGNVMGEFEKNVMPSS